MQADSTRFMVTLSLRWDATYRYEEIDFGEVTRYSGRFAITPTHLTLWHSNGKSHMTFNYDYEDGVLELRDITTQARLGRVLTLVKQDVRHAAILQINRQVPFCPWGFSQFCQHFASKASRTRLKEAS
jgi:hypothetical protein